MTDVVAVVGAGTMGAGIAQVAASSGHRVLVHDAVPGAAERAVAGVRDRIASLVAKGKIDVDPDAVDLTAVTEITELAPADLVVEAIVEDLAAKQQLFTRLAEIVSAECVLATNTSSLSPTAIAVGVARPRRVVGLHFFNPVPLMRLVEVVPGLDTDASVVDKVAKLVSTWGKTAVRSSATPGFIVNRIARPFYAEAWRLVEERAADPPTIDAVLTGAGGFRMGPFALMDLVGHDVNLAVTRSVWTGFGYDPRFTPSAAQQELVAAGRLGRKTGRGVYGPEGASTRPAARQLPPAEVVDHGAIALRGLLTRSGVAVLEGDGETGGVELAGDALLLRCAGTTATELAARHARPIVLVDRTLDDDAATAVAITASAGCPQSALDQAIGLLQAAGLDVHPVGDVPGLIVARTVAMLVNFAVDALRTGVASAEDIDNAMRLGTNYPIGPLAWGDRWGAATVHAILAEIQAVDGSPRYHPSPLLRRHALTGQSLT